MHHNLILPTIMLLKTPMINKSTGLKSTDGSILVYRTDITKFSSSSDS